MPTRASRKAYGDALLATMREANAVRQGVKLQVEMRIEKHETMTSEWGLGACAGRQFSISFFTGPQPTMIANRSDNVETA